MGSGNGDGAAVLATRALSVADAAGRPILRHVTLDLPPRRVTALLGPSGAGKSTLLRCFNRLVDLAPGLVATGLVTLQGRDVRGLDPDELRRRVGIVLQEPVTFRGSILRNVVFAARQLGLVTRAGAPELAERCLRQAGLWEETRDRLAGPALALSVGQRQRLAIARSLASGPEVLLMDEPTAALDPRATEAVEETIRRLAASTTIVLVTHQPAQAARLADVVAFLDRDTGNGSLVEAGPAARVLHRPERPETARFLGIG